MLSKIKINKAKSILLAITLILEDIEIKMNENWDFFAPNTRQNAIELEAYISVIKYMTKALNNLIVKKTD